METSRGHQDPIAILVAERCRFLAFLARRAASREAAEEILQSAYARGVAEQGSLERETSVIAWFYRLLRSAVVDHNRRTDAERRALARLAEEERVFDGDLATFEEELLRTVCGCVTALVDTLKPAYAEALITVDLENGSLEELASRAGIKKNNAAVRVHRARRALRDRLISCCGRCFDAGCDDCGCEPRPRA